MRLLLLPVLAVFHFAASAGTFSIEAELKVSGETAEQIDKSAAEKEGWAVSREDDETVYKLNKTIEESDLPFRTELGDAYLSVNKSGSAEMGISVGDADASSEAALQWPIDRKKFVDLGRALTFSVGGGDHASGSWNINGKLTLNYKN